MIQNIYKKGYVLLATSVTIILISLAIGSYSRYSTSVTLEEFNKDLATLRGYWAVYGAKELNSSMRYNYYRLTSNNKLYDVDANQTTWSLARAFYDWNLTNTSNSGIKDDMLFHRTLEVDSNDKISSYN